MTTDFADEFKRYRLIAEKAMAQLSDDSLNRVLSPEGNSIAMIVRHVSGNFISRFTDFLTTDGEKPWRNRDAEFETREYSRTEVDALWAEGWRVLEGQLANLSDAQLENEVRIRGAPLTVHAALSRSLAHIAYHVGQIVFMARVVTEGNWEWISIPKGQSQAYNRDPTLEKRPR